VSARRWVVALLGAALAASRPAAAQPPDAPLTLGALHRRAAARDPRARQLALQRERTALRLRTLAAERLPALDLEAQAQLQSDVTRLAVALPGGSTVPSPARDTYDAHLGVRQRLLDPTREARRQVDRARLAQVEAELRVALQPLRQQVNDAYFQALALDARAGELAAALTDLEAQAEQARARVRAGAALPGDTAALRAELLRRRVDRDGVLADRRAALAVLADLTGVRVPDSASLPLPALRAPAPGAAGRPEFETFARTRELLAARAALADAGTRPQLSAFGRAGYGRPGLNLLSRDFDAYWLAGLQLRWTPFDWGAAARERRALAVEGEVVRAEEDAFAAQLARSTARDTARIAHLEAALREDDAIVALREQVERETRLRFGEGVVTAADYVNRRTDVLDARLARAAHAVELAQARARQLTTLGVDLP
jgi:outer membrane protein TolC